MLINKFYKKSLLVSLLVCQQGLANTKTNTFIDNGNGSVTDIARGLMWQMQDDNIARLYAGAINYCNSLSLAGKSDWRLPALKELSSIVDYRVNAPSVNRSLFPDTNLSPYWSITNRASASNSAWVVLFDTGRVTSDSKIGGIESGDVFVRCVRTTD